MAPHDPEWFDRARLNAQTIEAEVRALSSGHWSMLERDYRGFWAHAKSVSQAFKELKPLLREERERLWAKFGAVCEEVKAKQQSEHEKRRYRSSELRSIILAEVESSRPIGGYLFTVSVDTLKALGERLKKAGTLLSEYKHQLLGEHKQDCFGRILEMREVHDAWWRQMNAQREHRHAELQARVRSNLEKNYERHRKAADALTKCRASADELRSKIDSAWNDNWRSNAYGWLSDLESKIRDIESHIERLESWIREDEAKLK